jgi:hypothetical protein
MATWSAATCALVIAAAQASAAPAPKAKPVAPASLTGCLHNDGGHFKLTDLPDSQAPKGRTWKTGYVTKSNKDVEVLGAANLKLKDHVGHKVTIVGTRDGSTRVKATSLKMVATRCS